MEVGVLLFFLLFGEAASLLSLQVVDKVLNGVALLLAAAETVEIKFLQLGRGVLFTIALKNHLFPLFLALLASLVVTVLVVLWVRRCVLVMSLVLYMRLPKFK